MAIEKPDSSFSGSVDSSIESVDASVEAVKKYIQGFLRPDIKDDGYAIDEQIDEAGNAWLIEVRGEPDAVQQFVVQNNNTPVVYNLTYHDDGEADGPLPEGDDTPISRGDAGDESSRLAVYLALDLSTQVADASGYVDIDLMIDPSIGFDEEDYYIIDVNRPVGASWQEFAVRYRATGGVDVEPLSFGLQEFITVNSLDGTLKASAQARAYQFKVIGTHPAGATYTLFPRGRIQLIG